MCACTSSYTHTHANIKIEALIQKVLSQHEVKVAIIDNDEFMLQIYADVMTDVSTERFNNPDTLCNLLKNRKNFGFINISVPFYQLSNSEQIRIGEILDKYISEYEEKVK